jgi:hypothetical protein
MGGVSGLAVEPVAPRCPDSFEVREEPVTGNRDCVFMVNVDDPLECLVGPDALAAGPSNDFERAGLDLVT